MEEPRICLNCNHSFSGRYCNQCGEKVIDPNDRSFKSMIMHLSEAMFNLDNKLFRSGRLLLSKPGYLTHFYSYGPRKKYLSPLSMFILISVLYFLFPVFETFNSTLITHLNFGFYSETAGRLVMEYTGGNEEKFNDYMVTFNESTGKFGKIAIFIFVVILTIPLALLNYSNKHFIADHTMASFEVNGFLIFLNIVILPLIVVIGSIIGIEGIGKDGVMAYFILIFMISFSFMLHVNYYKNQWWLALIKSGILMTILIGALHLYRCVVFYITHWSIT